jgi:hypothetical protein
LKLMVERYGLRITQMEKVPRLHLVYRSING